VDTETYGIEIIRVSGGTYEKKFFIINIFIIIISLEFGSFPANRLPESLVSQISS